MLACKVSLLNPEADRVAAIDNVAVTFDDAAVAEDSTKTNNFQCMNSSKEPTDSKAKLMALNPISLACFRTCHLSKNPQKMIETCFVFQLNPLTAKFNVQLIVCSLAKFDFIRKEVLPLSFHPLAIIVAAACVHVFSSTFTTYLKRRIIY